MRELLLPGALPGNTLPTTQMIRDRAGDTRHGRILQSQKDEQPDTAWAQIWSHPHLPGHKKDGGACQMTPRGCARPRVNHGKPRDEKPEFRHQTNSEREEKNLQIRINSQVHRLTTTHGPLPQTNFKYETTFKIIGHLNSDWISDDIKELLMF